MTEAEAEERLKKVISEDGGLYSLDWYLGWKPKETFATLDGEFSANDLEAIAIYMRKNK